MLHGERFREAQEELPAEVGASGLLFSSTEDDVVFIEAVAVVSERSLRSDPYWAERIATHRISKYLA